MSACERPFDAPIRQLVCSLPFLSPAWKRAGYNVLTQCYYSQQNREMASMRRFFTKIWGNKEPLMGPVGVGIIYVVPMPRSWSAKRKNEYLGKRCCAKPDFDNLTKFLLDAMNGIVYGDDQQCYGSEVGFAKYWGQDGRTYLFIETDDRQLQIEKVEELMPANMKTRGNFGNLQPEIPYDG